MKIKILGILLALYVGFSHAEIKTVQGKTFDINQEEWLHLVFFEVWVAYSDTSLQELYASLPTAYHNTVQTLWVQPRFNITKAQILEFQSVYPDISPIVMDENFELMRKFDLWSSPSHVILNKGEIVFVGGSEDFKNFATEFDFTKI